MRTMFELIDDGSQFIPPIPYGVASEEFRDPVLSRHSPIAQLRAKFYGAEFRLKVNCGKLYSAHGVKTAIGYLIALRAGVPSGPKIGAQ